jgi:DMSO reductase iron-sulfur subunit
MALPLLERAKKDGITYVLTPLPKREPNRARSEHLHEIAPSPAAPRIPQIGLQPGEQYRFHFDMTTCVGCKCCVVACNEQNGNPAEINWRRVGEIEGGWYPETQRLYLSMGCNHCLEPSCLVGCPVDAYRKDPETGIVLHSAETCIGCQYCTWNCSYGVPQYNPERGVVGKCDMCYGRLSEGREPACVNACPTGSIKVEIVKVAEWRREYAATANAPGLPSADDSFSTTRITRPDNLPPNTSKVDSYRVHLEDPHWPLVVMTVLTQLSAGALAAIWLRQLLGGAMQLGIAALASLVVGGLALSASTMHLGRPAHAYRALKMWKRSWLSREVLMFSLFSSVAALYAGTVWFRLPGSMIAGGLTTLLGIAGVTASACIYLVHARPAWNTKRTVAEFYLSGALLGPLFAASLGVTTRALLWATVIAATAQLLNIASKFLWLVRSDVFELQASARLFSTVLASGLQLRVILLICGGIVLPLLLPGRIGVSIALAVALTGEFLGRYLFFVSVVPKNMAAAYLADRKRAA